MVTSITNHKSYIFLLLLLLHSAVAAAMEEHTLVVRVKSYNSVDVDSDIPGLQVDYIQKQESHYATRLQAGDTALLTISGLPQGELLWASVSIHSNKASGAGSLLLTDYTMPIWGIADAPFSSLAWNGTYTTDFTEIRHSFTKSYYTGDICLRIVASENSLYFKSFTLVYQTPEKAAHTVAFNTHSTSTCAPLTEDSIETGIWLPSLPDADENWHFIGWSETPLFNTQNPPNYLAPHTRYYPTCDITLHAIYADRQQPFEYYDQDTTFADGTYLLCNPYAAAIAYGPWDNKMLHMRSCSLWRDSLTTLWKMEWAQQIDSACLYDLTFREDTLRLVHTMSGQYITNKYNQQPWVVQTAADHSIALLTPGTSYGLMPDWDGFRIASLYLAEESLFILLFPADPFLEPQPVTNYSSFITPAAVQTQPTTKRNAHLLFEDGRLVLRVGAKVYSVDGQRIR